MTDQGLKKLLALFSDDPDGAGELYLHIQGKLIRYFTWNICANPEEMADEVLDRVARRVAEGEQVLSPISYVFGVARRVLLEAKPKTLLLPLQDELEAAPGEYDESALISLDDCLEKLAPRRSPCVEGTLCESCRRSVASCWTVLPPDMRPTPTSAATSGRIFIFSCGEASRRSMGAARSRPGPFVSADNTAAN